jgi:hypothetical protein
MRSSGHVCGPDELKLLQQIFDSILSELEQEPASCFADPPVLRLQVARSVMERASGDLLDVNTIKHSVLNSLRTQ